MLTKHVAARWIPTRLLLLALASCLATLSCTGKEDGKPGDGEDRGSLVPALDLYSWQNPGGGWDFCLLPGADRKRTAEEIRAAQPTLHGLDQLKDAISKLSPIRAPSGSHGLTAWILGGGDQKPSGTRLRICSARSYVTLLSMG